MQTRIASIYGDTANDFLGSNGVTALSNGNYVIASSEDDFGGEVDAGSVMLVNGTTGAQIGSTIAGDQAGDQLGLGRVTALRNGNYVIASPSDEPGGVLFAGSVILVSGTTGVQIGSTLVGDQAHDSLGDVTALSNGNYVIASPGDDVGGVFDVGSVMLVNGTTGAPIGIPLAGDQAGDRLGSGGVTALSNGNYVIPSRFDDVGGVVDAGSVILVNGTTGVQIGSAITGDQVADQLGWKRITALSNGNYVIASEQDDVGGVVDAGSVILVNGTTGVQIGSAIAGDQVADQLGWSGITALSNGNYVIASEKDDVGGVGGAGSVMLVNGTTGAQIGSAIAGDQAGDQLGLGRVTTLSNGNYVIASPLDNPGGVGDAGSVILVNGTTGVQIGSTIAGDQVADQLGWSGITALSNGNYVIASSVDDVGGVADAGSVMLVDGATGAQIGSTIAGDQAGDRLGEGRVTALSNGNYLIASHFDDVGGVVNAGSVMLINGTTGAQIGSTIVGSVSWDMEVTLVAGSSSGAFFVLAFPLWDNAAGIDSGLVLLIAQ